MTIQFQVNRGRQMVSEDTIRSRSSTRLPNALAPLDDERARIERILDRLETTEDLIERADLASELVRSASRYEDTLERTVWPMASNVPTAALKELADDREALREVMMVIHERTMHVDPRNVHAPDPQGFEDTLEEVAQRLRAILLDEDRQITVIEAALGSPDEREKLTNDIAHALHTASERPKPPRTRLGRALVNANVKLDHTLEDVSSPQHPGSDTIKGTEA
jgi:hypothetical protein